MTMRRLICFLLYAAMTVAGVYIVAGFILHGGRGIIAVVGATLTGFGIYLLWIDVLAPPSQREPL
jgi:hypothetical protein